MKFKLKPLALGLLAAAQTATSLRFVMYVDEYHTQNLPTGTQTNGITHAVMAFAKSTLFTSDPPQKWTPFEPVDTFRNRFGKDAKVTVAIGGWGDTSGFSEGAKDEASRTRYAKNVRAFVDEFGLDGV
ncbi:glycoside hydrolase superfamily, partial [Aspergillus alliaceus]